MARGAFNDNDHQGDSKQHAQTFQYLGDEVRVVVVRIQHLRQACIVIARCATGAACLYFDDGYEDEEVKQPPPVTELLDDLPTTGGHPDNRVTTGK